MHMAPMIDIVFLSVYNGLFERPSAVRTDEFQTVGVDTGVSALGDEFLAVSPERGTVEFVRAEGVAFLDDETFVDAVVGFVHAADDGSGSDVAAHKAGSVAAGSERKSEWFVLLVSFMRGLTGSEYQWSNITYRLHDMFFELCYVVGKVYAPSFKF